MIKKIKFPLIGQIRIHEIIDEYDFPILFVGVDIFDSFILFQVVSNVDNKKITIANKITKDTYKKLKTNETSIQSIYREPEQDVFYLICEENEVFDVTSTGISNLAKFGITKGNSYFGTLSKDTLVEKSALENAILTNRPTIDFIFDSPYTEYPSMNAKSQIGLVDSFLKMYDNFSQYHNQLNISMLPGSVKLRFEAPSTLFSGEEASIVFEKISSTIQSKDIVQIGEVLEYDRKKLTDYDKLLKSINKVESKTVKINFATPNDILFDPIQMNNDSVKERISLINQIKKNVSTETIEVIGILTAADKNMLSIKISDDNQNYSAKFEKKYVDYKFVINNQYKFILMVNIIQFNDSEELKKTYKLISLEELS